MAIETPWAWIHHGDTPLTSRLSMLQPPPLAHLTVVEFQRPYMHNSFSEVVTNAIPVRQQSIRNVAQVLCAVSSFCVFAFCLLALLRRGSEESLVRHIRIPAVLSLKNHSTSRSQCPLLLSGSVASSGIFLQGTKMRIRPGDQLH
ncbi:hypothetical protein BDR04DRAFT_1105171 [Suillus decipiens]|nr:hypothetical protein BDR04DRAFT_1105171 [Suillus decipiens]